MFLESSESFSVGSRLSEEPNIETGKTEKWEYQREGKEFESSDVNRKRRIETRASGLAGTSWIFHGFVHVSLTRLHQSNTCVGLENEMIQTEEKNKRKRREVVQYVPP